MAVPNGLDPVFDRVTLGNGVATIYSGATTLSTAITAEVGAPALGSIYLSSNGSGEIWVATQGDAANTWTKLTIN
jgi:hypothetical protein